MKFASYFHVSETHKYTRAQAKRCTDVKAKPCDWGKQIAGNRMLLQNAVNGKSKEKKKSPCFTTSNQW
ncbi:MAG: hypothetical protein LCH81_06840 [Bacteroidetes bacterium]|nr:hypothetical protein [Bacteroidota bacterium]